ncbi:FadR/GntR family transcriptional regulator [Sinorhizobium alkalisoli]|uniref:Transcriptional regulator n=1 Tax=Sinorhizobium alkalisoli TaxID=1752398 RepID=A0A1E3VGN5_9HYPH|nr:FadR/GntR family transcriptional regulator [Sinorhizobium alkalisoli]MCA1490618.1 FadR family transcriptional regulator [Ensifer sp. NBAIM29]MCG5478518.1 FadR family transcriptional regulator [Sinorhizobium alkalisoli]ODR92728.1 transcriptional regulator [Sinorhizobium alkalisoli]
MTATIEKTKPISEDEKRLYVPAERTRRRPEAIAERIKDFIRTERLLPGDRLPQEKTLIEEFKAAKGTVREAMKTLETQGLIYTRSGPGGGAFVAQPSAQHAMELLGAYFFFDQPNLSEIYAIRKALEPEIAALLAGHLRPAQLAELESTIRIYDQTPENVDEQYRQRVAELDFHSQLAQLCPNRLLGFLCGLMHNLLRDLPLARRIYADPKPTSREEGLLFQYRLMAALKDGRSEEARAIAREHMDFAERYMLARAEALANEENE